MVTTATASGDNGTTLSVVQSSSKRPLEVNTPSPVQPSQKKVRLQMEELSSLDGQPVTPSSAAVPTGGDKSVPQVGVDSPLKVAGDVARKLPSPGPVQLAAVLEERMKVWGRRGNGGRVGKAWQQNHCLSHRQRFSM